MVFLDLGPPLKGIAGRKTGGRRRRRSSNGGGGDKAHDTTAEATDDVEGPVETYWECSNGSTVLTDGTVATTPKQQQVPLVANESSSPSTTTTTTTKDEAIHIRKESPQENTGEQLHQEVLQVRHELATTKNHLDRTLQEHELEMLETQQSNLDQMQQLIEQHERALQERDSLQATAVQERDTAHAAALVARDRQHAQRETQFLEDAVTQVQAEMHATYQQALEQLTAEREQSLSVTDEQRDRQETMEAKYKNAAKQSLQRHQVELKQASKETMLEMKRMRIQFGLIKTKLLDSKNAVEMQLRTVCGEKRYVEMQLLTVRSELAHLIDWDRRGRQPQIAHHTETQHEKVLQQSVSVPNKSLSRIQEAQAGSLDTHTKAVDRVKEVLGSSTNDSVVQERDQLRRRLEEMLTTHQATLDQLKKEQVVVIKQRDDELVQELEKMRNAFFTSKASLMDSNTELKSKLEQVERNLTESQAMVQAKTDEFEALRQSLEVLEEEKQHECTRLEPAIVAENVEISALRKTQDDLMKKAKTELESQLEQVKQDLAALKERRVQEVGEPKEELRMRDDSCSKLQAPVQAKTNEIDALQQSLEVLEEKKQCECTRLESALVIKNVEIAALKKTQAELVKTTKTLTETMALSTLKRRKLEQDLVQERKFSAEIIYKQRGTNDQELTQRQRHATTQTEEIKVLKELIVTLRAACAKAESRSLELNAEIKALQESHVCQLQLPDAAASADLQSRDDCHGEKVRKQERAIKANAKEMADIKGQVPIWEEETTTEQGIQSPASIRRVLRSTIKLSPETRGGADPASPSSKLLDMDGDLDTASAKKTIMLDMCAKTGGIPIAVRENDSSRSGKTVTPKQPLRGRTLRSSDSKRRRHDAGSTDSLTLLPCSRSKDGSPESSFKRASSSSLKTDSKKPKKRLRSSIQFDDDSDSD